MILIKAKGEHKNRVIWNIHAWYPTTWSNLKIADITDILCYLTWSELSRFSNRPKRSRPHLSISHNLHFSTFIPSQTPRSLFSQDVSVEISLASSSLMILSHDILIIIKKQQNPYSKSIFFSCWCLPPSLL